MLTTLNTFGGNGIRFGFASTAPALDSSLFEHFNAVQGVVITPSLIPSVTLGYGLVVNGLPLIGISRWSC